MNRIYEKYKSDLKEVIHNNTEQIPTGSTDPNRMMSKQCYRYTSVTDQQVFMSLFSNIQVNFNKVAFKNLEIGQAYVTNPFLNEKEFGTKTGEDEVMIATDTYKIRYKVNPNEKERRYYPIVFNKVYDPDFDIINYPCIKMFETENDVLTETQLCIASNINQPNGFVFYGNDSFMINRIIDKKLYFSSLSEVKNIVQITPVYYKHLKNSDIFFIPGKDKNDILNYHICQKNKKMARDKNFHCNGRGSISQSKSINDHLVVFKFTFKF